MLVLPDGFNTANEYLIAAIQFLERYEWLYNWPVTEVLTSGVLDKMPVQWWPVLHDLTNEELNLLPRGYCNASWPESLKHFVRTSAALRLPAADEPLPELNKECFSVEQQPNNPSQANVRSMLQRVLRKGLSPKKCHEVTHLAALIHKHCQNVGLHCVVDMGSGHGYLCEVLHQCYGYRVIGLEARLERVVEAQERHKKICASLGVTDLSGVTHLKCDVSASSPGPIMEALGSVGHTTPFCLVGLHSCGDLTPSAMSLFLQIDHLRAMVLVACCYHTMQQMSEQNPDQSHSKPIAKPKSQLVSVPADSDNLLKSSQTSRQQACASATPHPTSDSPSTGTPSPPHSDQSKKPPSPGDGRRWWSESTSSDRSDNLAALERQWKAWLAASWAGAGDAFTTPVKNRRVAKSTVRELRGYESEPEAQGSNMSDVDKDSRTPSVLALDHFERTTSLKQLLLHLLTRTPTSYKPEHFLSFPMSAELRELTRRGCSRSPSGAGACRGPCTFLRRPFLRLAAQESLERWELMSVDQHRQHCIHVMTRAVFDLYTAGRDDFAVEKLHRRCIRRSKLQANPAEILGELVDRMLPALKSSLEAEMHKDRLLHLFQVLGPLGPLIEGLAGLQTALHMTCEGLILVDRHCALNIPTASIVKVADQRQTPRCYALVAVK